MKTRRFESSSGVSSTSSSFSLPSFPYASEKKCAEYSQMGKILGPVTEKQMRGDQSAPRAHRTGLIIFMMLRHGRAELSRRWDASFPPSCDESLLKKRAIQPSSCYWQQPVVPWLEYISPAFYFHVRSCFITYCDDRRLRINRLGHCERKREKGKGDDSDIKMKRFMKYIMRWDAIRVNNPFTFTFLDTSVNCKTCKSSVIILFQIISENNFNSISNERNVIYVINYVSAIKRTRIAQ